MTPVRQQEITTTKKLLAVLSGEEKARADKEIDELSKKHESNAAAVQPA
jgi:hypothetical protein